MGVPLLGERTPPRRGAHQQQCRVCKARGGCATREGAVAKRSPRGGGLRCSCVTCPKRLQRVEQDPPHSSWRSHLVEVCQGCQLPAGLTPTTGTPVPNPGSPPQPQPDVWGLRGHPERAAPCADAHVTHTRPWKQSAHEQDAGTRCAGSPAPLQGRTRTRPYRFPFPSQHAPKASCHLCSRQLVAQEPKNQNRSQLSEGDGGGADGGLGLQLPPRHNLHPQPPAADSRGATPAPGDLSTHGGARSSFIPARGSRPDCRRAATWNSPCTAAPGSAKDLHAQLEPEALHRHRAAPQLHLHAHRGPPAAPTPRDPPAAFRQSKEQSEVAARSRAVTTKNSTMEFSSGGEKEKEKQKAASC